MITNFNIPVSLGDPIFLIDDEHINQLTVTSIKINLDGSWSADCKKRCCCRPFTFSEKDINNSVFLDYDRALLVLSVRNPNAYGLSYPKFPFSVNQKVYRINYDVFPYTIEEMLIYRIECNTFYYTYNQEIINKSLVSTKTREDLYASEWEVLKTASGNEYTVCKNCNIDFSFRTDKGTIAKLDMRGVNYCPNCGVLMK